MYTHKHKFRPANYLFIKTILIINLIYLTCLSCNSYAQAVAQIEQSATTSTKNTSMDGLSIHLSSHLVNPPQTTDSSANHSVNTSSIDIETSKNQAQNVHYFDAVDVTANFRQNLSSQQTQVQQTQTITQNYIHSIESPEKLNQQETNLNKQIEALQNAKKSTDSYSLDTNPLQKFIPNLGHTQSNTTKDGNSESLLTQLTQVGNLIQKGMASWYGPRFHGRLTANGEVYNMHGMSAAHKTLKLGTTVKVVNSENQKSLTLKINDRGPYIKGRVLDLSYAAAKYLGIIQHGKGHVEIYEVKK